MTKHEKKVLEALNTIVDKKRKVRDATKDEHEKERLNTEIIGFLDCIYILRRAPGRGQSPRAPCARLPPCHGLVMQYT